MKEEDGVSGVTKDTAWFERVLDSIEEMVLVKGDRSRLQWANKAFRDAYGMSQAQLQDIVDSPASDPDDTVQYVRDDHHVFTTGESLLIPAEAVTHHNGELHYYDTAKSPIRDSAGTVVGLVGVSRLTTDADLKERSQLDRAARKGTLQELTTMVANIPLGVAMFDRQRRLIAASHMWEALFDSSLSAPGEFYDEQSEVQLAIGAAMAEVVTSGEAFERDAMTMIREASDAVVSVTIRPWELGVRDIGGVVVLVNDRTEQLGTAAELGRASAELAQFNYRISHDLVAPLATSEGLIAMALRRLRAGDVAIAEACMDRVAQENARLRSLIANVLELSRADLTDLKPTQVRLHDLFERVFEANQGYADSEGVSLSYSSDTDGILTTDHRLYQILTGLLDNAVKYHGEQVDRWVSLNASTVHGKRRDRLEIRVSDNGLGVAPTIASSIFEIFVRGRATHPGSGLGLYIAKSHAERMGGKLTLESMGSPTVFLLSIPLNRTKELPAGQEPT